MDERFDTIEEKLEELSEKLEEISCKVDSVSSDIETEVENAVESAMSDLSCDIESTVEDAVSNISSGQSPLITVFSQDKKFIVPIYSVEARRVKKDQDPYLIMAQTSPSGNTRIIGRYPNKEAALTEMKNLAEAINLSTVNRTKFYEIK